ncbi:hypothetical protein DFR58_12456 [Anaerobacterium chartisolvens]|uniref:Uncharacterized protein n=1 Tax=Anaerobacterium chartisolvens TaxID=1297424 RepID=A0A369AV24_9FIRM|nr:O-methyltransferase [Anaerobacterium chartisolvens]RCX12106.1 hypothetical protein DFR58_12456 [Anaerobacterium chartisolvens]
MGKQERQNINYYLRPAKSIERKFFCDIFRKLEVFSPLRDYQYIGMGSKYFVDFTLFHKELGISKMYSIEGNASSEQEQNRFEFNKPFKCINMVFKSSSNAINDINWNTKSIVWLDYDEIFSRSNLHDIKNIVLNLLPHSVLLVTCNGNYSPDDQTDDRFEVFKKEFEDDVPMGTKKNQIVNKLFHQLVNEMINNKIQEALIEKNASISDDNEKMIFKQLVYFTYKDGSPMVTIGGVFIGKRDEEIFNNTNFYDFFFNNNIAHPYDIYLPNLTYKELQKINTQLPCENWSDINLFGLREEDLKIYMELYRYYPFYMESRFTG